MTWTEADMYRPMFIETMIERETIGRKAIGYFDSLHVDPSAIPAHRLHPGMFHLEQKVRIISHHPLGLCRRFVSEALREPDQGNSQEGRGHEL